MSEFDVIEKYFSSAAIKRDDVSLGIGDDCALLKPVAGYCVAVSTDTLIEGVHFPAQTNAIDIGYKALAVNLSDLAAMGAKPAWVTLAISLPDINAAWLNDFMLGFTDLAQQYQLSLVGGDTTRGPLSISITVMGLVEESQALKRSSAKVDDIILLTGTVGDAQLGLQAILESWNPDMFQWSINKLNRPEPAVNAGLSAAGIASSAIDISDGLLSDLGHICSQSKTGADIHLDKLPLSDELRRYYDTNIDWNSILNGGDDYVLCLTCQPQYYEGLKKRFEEKDLILYDIGTITQQTGVRCYLHGDIVPELTAEGYNHFAAKK